MTTKRVSYMALLKEAISEFDTSDNVDVKGPMLDPILGYDGGGELPTHKNVSDILERYYFNQKEDKGVTVNDINEEVDHIDKDAVDDKGKAMPKEAPNKDSDVSKLKAKITDAMKDLTGSEEVNEQEDEEAKKMEDGEEGEESEEGKEKEEGDEEDLDVDKEVETESQELSEVEEIENQIIEKLISEMEGEVSEQDFTKDDSGTKAAPGDMDDRALVPSFDKVPDRKDKAEKVGPPAAEIKEDEEIDEDISEMLGPDLRSSANDPEDMGDKESVDEQFLIFKEAIKEEDEDPTELDSSEIRV